LLAHHTAFRHYINYLQLPWRKTQRKNLIRWAAASLVRQSLPVRRLARTLAPTPQQARQQDNRLRRFLGNERLQFDAALGAYLRFLLPRLGPSAYIPVMLDWTYFGDRAILTLGVPYHGRSLPLFVTVHERTVERRVYSQTQAEISLLRRVRWQWPASATPLLLADRSFDKSRLLEWLLHGTTGKKPHERAPSAPGSHPWLFLIRSCMQATVRDQHGKRLQKRLTVYPGETLCYPHVTYHQTGEFHAHLVVTCARDRLGHPSTWYLLTNLPTAELSATHRAPALRMPPEETYRDYKQGFILSGFGLKGLKRLRRDRLERLLCYVALVCGFLVLVAESEKEVRAAFAQRHFRLSLISFALDVVRVVPQLLLRLARQACASVRLEPVCRKVETPECSRGLTPWRWGLGRSTFTTC